MADQPGKDQRQLRNTADELREITQETDSNLKAAFGTLKKITDQYEKIVAQQSILQASSLDIKNIEKDLLKLQTQQKINSQSLSKLDKDFNESAKEKIQKEDDLLKKIEKASQISLKKGTIEYKRQQELIRGFQTQLDLTRSQFTESEAESRARLEITKNLEKQIKLLELSKEAALEAKSIRDRELTTTDKLLKKIGDNFGIFDKYYTRVQEDIDKIIDSTDKTTKVQKWKIFKETIKDTFKDPLIQALTISKANDAIFSGIGKAFGFVKDIAQQILGLITGWNDRVFELGKNLGVGEADSRAMMNNFQNMAMNSGPLFLNSKKISETFTEMTNSLGLMVPMDNEMLQTATLLQRQFGLSAEDLASIYANSALSGKSFKDTFDTIEGIRGSEGGRLKTMMTTKQIVGEISKVSSLVLLNFKGNVPALASAVVESKRLGLSLDQVAATTNGFLDFESSISKEFEAQLLTGKDLNLQRLRYLALTHDTAGMMAEIGKRIPSMLEFEKMNTIERQSYAEAMNMSEEGLAEIIKKQEIAAKLGVNATDSATQMYEELKKSGLSQAEIAEKMKDAGAQQYYTAAMSEKISTFIDNIKTTLGQMLEGELGKTIDNFLNLMNNTKTWHMWMEKVEGVVKGIGSFFANLPEKIQAVLKAVSVLLGVLAIAEAGIGLAMLPVNPIGAAAAFLGAAKIGAAAAAAGYAASTVGDMISVSKNAVANQSYSPSDNTNTGTAANAGGSHTYVQPQVTVINAFDSQTISTLTIQNAKQSSIVDHSSDGIKSKTNAKIVESKAH